MYEVISGGPPWPGMSNQEAATRVIAGERMRLPPVSAFSRSDCIAVAAVNEGMALHCIVTGR